ncbi:MAG: prolyl oligopeptidase family serine peptidase, partial [Isosphaeraceae bacterium]
MLDPVSAQLVAGTWSMPQKDQTVTLRNGQTERWRSVRADSRGTFALPKPRSYLAIEVPSAKEQVLILEASVHTQVYINDVPRVGDPYANGYVRLPVKLKHGKNTLLFEERRNRSISAKLVAPRAEAELNAGDVTLPDLVTGENLDADAAIIAINSSDTPLEHLSIASKLGPGPLVRTRLPVLPPLSVRKVGFRIKGPSQGSQTSPLELKLERSTGSDWKTLFSVTLWLRVRNDRQTRKRTFRSDIDGSVQYYALVPALALPDGAKAQSRKPGLVFTLHGAGVEANGQAEAYAPKPGLFIVAPTNRRPFGFDWEDWGRLDALEVLELAQRTLGTDPSRTYLTGHSMGGHGTWHLGVTFPDRFAAVAPSAGWISMMSYAGMKKSDSTAPIDQLFARAVNPSDTLALVSNLAPRGVYVLHGDADDNVPVSQARRMREALGTFHPDFAYHEQPGAGHWWGSPCVDWPPLFTFLSER